VAGTVTAKCTLTPAELDPWKATVAGHQNPLRTELYTLVTTGTGFSERRWIEQPGRS
jgi:hypothetical protein